MVSQGWELKSLFRSWQPQEKKFESAIGPIIGIIKFECFVLTWDWSGTWPQATKGLLYFKVVKHVVISQYARSLMDCLSFLIFISMSVSSYSAITVASFYWSFFWVYAKVCLSVYLWNISLVVCHIYYLRVWARIWSLGDNLSPWLKFLGTFSFLGAQKFVHLSADAKGFVFLAGLLKGLGRKRQILRDF